MKAAVQILLLNLQTSSMETKQINFQLAGMPGEERAGAQGRPNPR